MCSEPVTEQGKCQVGPEAAPAGVGLKESKSLLAGRENAPLTGIKGLDPGKSLESSLDMCMVSSCLVCFACLPPRSCGHSETPLTPEEFRVVLFL